MTLSNNGPKSADDYNAPLEALNADLQRFDGLELNSDLAAELNDLIKAVQGVGKSAETDRKAIKEPHLNASRQVDADFAPIKQSVADMVKRGKGYLTPYLVEQDRIANELRRKAEQEAAEKARIAEALANDALIGDSVAKDAEDAERNLQIATAAASNAGRVGSASGDARTASLRTYRTAEIVDIEKAALFFCTHPSVQDAIVTAANAIIRNAKGGFVKMDGISIKEEKRVA